jgi:predicted metal-dependent peptidase
VSDREFDRTRFAAARLAALDLQPFLGTALFALVPITMPGLGTFGVTKDLRLFIDPDKLDKWTIPEVAGVLLHEVCHVIHDHADRSHAIGVSEGNRNRWNWAADAEINDDLVADGVVLPGQPVLPELFGQERGKAAEHYFHVLADDLPPLDCGPGVHGQHDARFGSDATEGLSELAVALVRSQVAEAILSSGKLAGKEPSPNWMRWAREQKQPTVDWRRLLRSNIRAAVLSRSGAVDYTYRFPSRRRVDGVVLPALAKPVPNLAVVIDTSASVDDAALAQAWAETKAAVSAVGVRREQIAVWAADTVPRRVASNHSAEGVKLPGGGGTDMVGAINAAIRAHPTPDVVIVLTDGLTPWPSTATRAALVVGLLPSIVAPPAPPAWARVVHVG